MKGLSRRRVSFLRKFSHDAAKRIVFLLLWSGVNVIVSRSLIKTWTFSQQLSSAKSFTLQLFDADEEQKKMRKLCINVITVLSLSLPIPFSTWRLEEVTLFSLESSGNVSSLPYVLCAVCRGRRSFTLIALVCKWESFFCFCVDCDPFVCCVRFLPKKII